MNSVNVFLTEDLEKFVNELIAGGMYYSVSEAVQDGLRRLKEREHLRKFRLEEIRGDIMKGYIQSQNGESKSFDIEAMKAEGEKRLS